MAPMSNPLSLMVSAICEIAALITMPSRPPELLLPLMKQMDMFTLLKAILQVITAGTEMVSIIKGDRIRMEI